MKSVSLWRERVTHWGRTPESMASCGGTLLGCGNGGPTGFFDRGTHLAKQPRREPVTMSVDCPEQSCQGKRYCPRGLHCENEQDCRLSESPQSQLPKDVKCQHFRLQRDVAK
ncbi:hypothetical protein JRQ81_018208 [Phrynocephalus forsythii]|uniref:Uncharacterized protein n=1 Tax=Phrynocephalus forsythii TaxID=171643 RepID=A0A9Q0XSD5_9SAUR|nr:hypothetical protein JRQ81_018208 [Phrynocephalus forsythii]